MRLDSSCFLFGALCALSLSVAGCRCNPDHVSPTGEVCANIANNQTDHPGSCESSAECADHYACNPVKDQAGLTCCTYGDRKCTTEADCCPGQTCPADRKKCFDKYLSCDTDADCGDKGDRFCEVYTDTYGSTKRCRFKVCGALGECPEGQSCFQGECMVDLPCNGTCESGKACVPSIDRCQDYSSPVGREAAACPVTCAPGFLATFKNNRDIWDACKLPEVQCVCSELPGLLSGDLGRFSALAVDSAKKELWVSMYDGEFGDLVIAKYGTDGRLQRREWIDGVPTGQPKYGPSGARGGIVEPGDDVGRYTDLVSSGDYLYVSYYDVTHGDLKFGARGADGKWTTYRVDGANADLGLYSSIAVDSDAMPAIAYFQRGGSATFNASECPAPVPTGDKAFITALKLARASKVNPSAADWTTKTIACKSRPTPACYNCSKVCADPGTGPGCYLAASSCTNCDPNTETCVTVGTQARCAKKYNPSNLTEVVDGAGLFASLAFNNKDAYIAYMRRTTAVPAGGTSPVSDGDLYGVHVFASGTVGSEILLDSAGDTGYFARLQVDPSTKKLAVAYQNFTDKQLRFYYAAAFATGGTPEIIDPGLGAAGSGEQSWVGTGTALVFGPGSSQLTALYQDATKGDLKMASRSGTWIRKASVRTDGAVGFFVDGSLLDGRLWVSHARVHAKLVGGEPKVDNSLILENLTPP